MDENTKTFIVEKLHAAYWRAIKVENFGLAADLDAIALKVSGRGFAATCVLCDAPCRFALCDACYAKAPIVEETESSSRPEPARFMIGPPVSFRGIHRF